MFWSQTAVLHDHLDGSRPLLNIMPELARLSGEKYRFDPNNDHHGQVKRWFENPQIDIVKKFSVTTGVMKTRETISLAAETYVRFRAKQGFRYCEITIAPQYLLPPELDEEIKKKGMLNDSGFIKKHIANAIIRVVDALIEGIRRGETEFPETEFNLLLSVGREVDSLTALRLIELFAECDRSYCPGVGLVCDEAAHKPEKHEPMFKRAKELGFKTTCHVGEWCDMPMFFHGRHFNLEAWKAYNTQLLRNIYTAVFMLEVDRLDHAIPLAYDDQIFRGELWRKVIEKNIGVTGCPGSYLFSKLIPNLKYLRIRDLLNSGVLYSLNPDDDLFMPDLDEVFEMCEKEYGFSPEEKRKLLLNPWLTRFGNRKQHNIPFLN